MVGAQLAVMMPSDRARACSLYDRIESALAESRACDDTVCEALKRVRGVMHMDFKELRVLRSFVIEDDLDFRIWHVRVRYPDDRIVDITHES